MAFEKSFSFEHRGWRAWSTVQECLNVTSDKTGLIWFPSVDAAVEVLTVKGYGKFAAKLAEAWSGHTKRQPAPRG